MKMYDSRKPFKSADFGHVKRELGVLVSLPFEHHGKPGHQRYVEVSYETPTVNTATYAKLAVLEHHWRPEAIAQTNCMINNIDKLILDLKLHRKRLVKERANLSRIEATKRNMIFQAIEANLS